MIVQQAKLVGDAPAHKDIVHHRQHLDDVQLLIDAGNADLPGLDGVAEGLLLAFHIDFTFFGDIDPGQHLDQGGLAGAIFPDQPMNLPGLDLYVHVPHGYHAGELFGDMLQFHNKLFWHGSPLLIQNGGDPGKHSGSPPHSGSTCSAPDEAPVKLFIFSDSRRSCPC